MIRKGISIAMCVTLLSGCAMNIKDQICLGVGVYAYVMGVREARRQRREAKDWTANHARSEQTHDAPAYRSTMANAMRESASPSISYPMGQSEDTFSREFSSAEEDYRRFRYQDCKRKMTRLALEQPSIQRQAQAYFYAGACAYYMRNYDEARQHFMKARELDPMFTPSATRFTPALVGFYFGKGR